MNCIVIISFGQTYGNKLWKCLKCGLFVYYFTRYSTPRNWLWVSTAMHCTFQLYNEEINDLLDEEGMNTGNIRIHEDSRGEIYMQGVTTKIVTDTLNVSKVDDNYRILWWYNVHNIDIFQTLEILKGGSLRRTVASTNMNEQSSRSHAIFSMFIAQKRVPEGVEFNVSYDQIHL